MKFQHLFLLFVTLTAPVCCSANMDTLIRDLKSSHESVKRSALDELGKKENLGNPESIKPLLEVVKSDKSFIFQEKAARVLSEHKSPQAVEGLIRIINDPSISSDSAALGLAEKKSPVVIEPLLKAIQDKSSRTRRHAVQGLTPFIKKDVRISEALFTSATQDNDFITRESAARSLVENADKKMTSRLIDSLDDSFNKGTGEVAKALGEAKKTDAIPALLRVLERNDKATVLNTVKGLKNFNDPRLVEPLMKVAGKSGTDFIAREYAVEHLAELADPRSRQLFIDLLQDPKSSLPLKRSAVSGLAKTGVNQDLIPLIELLGSDDTRIRTEALGSIRSILARSKNSQLQLKELVDCLPLSSQSSVQTGQLEMNYLLDVLFFGGIPVLTSKTLNNSMEKVDKVSPEVIKALQDLVKSQMA